MKLREVLSRWGKHAVFEEDPYPIDFQHQPGKAGTDHALKKKLGGAIFVLHD